MTKESTTWHSERLGEDATLVRWGEVGTPVLFFPTAAADAEECERFLMPSACSELLEEGRIKLYSVDSAAGRWLTEYKSLAHAARVQDRFDGFVYEEVVPAIRRDCDDESIEIVVTGPSIGAFNALAALCRHPDVFSTAICMSGTYDLKKFVDGPPASELRWISPLHLLPSLEDENWLSALRERFVLLAHGTGRWEEPSQSWRAAEVLGNRGIPNRVDEWGTEWDHDWPTWRSMLPHYLDELLD